MPSLGRWFAFGIPLLFSVSVSPLAAQTAAPSASNYPNEAVIIEKIVERLAYQDDGTFTEERSARLRIQSSAGVQQFGLLRFPYASGVGDEQILYVRVIKPNGTAVTTPPENVQDVPEQITLQAPFYSDLKEKQVAVKGLEIGDVLEFEARFDARSPEAPGQFWCSYSFTSDAIALDDELQITVPAGRAVILKSPRVQPTVSDADGKRIYSWTTNNLKRKSDAEIAKENASSEPRFPDVELTSFRDWNEVAQWYHQLQASRAEPTPEIRAKAAGLTKNATSEAEKIGILYDYVGTKFRYIGIAFGVGRYQAHAAAEVLSNGFGDCKDKYTPLAALLASVGVKSYPALANSENKIDPDVPSPAQFNHVINALPQAKGFLWLDTTTEVAPEGYLSPALRDKQVLLIADSGPSQFAKLPADLSFPQQFTFTTKGKIGEDGTLVAQTDITARGDVEVVLRVLLHQTPQPQWKMVVQGFSEGLGFAGTIDDLAVSSPEATGAPLDLKYSYNRKNYPDWPNQIGVPVPAPILSAISDDDDSVPERIPLQSGEMHLISEIELPAGVTPQLRRPVNIVTDFAEYHSSDTWNSGVLRVERRYISHLRELPKARSAAYRTFWKSVNDDETATLALTRGDVSTNPSSYAPFASPQAKSDYQRFVQTASEAAQQRNFPAAVQAGKDALALYESAEDWAYLANLELGNHERGQAYVDMKKALDLKPTGPATFNRLAVAFVQMHNDDDALAAWKKNMAVFPDDPTAPAAMGSYFMQKNRYAEAVALLKPAAEKHPEAAILNFDLGQAYLLVADPAHAVEAFTRALAANPSPLYLNDVAYLLAKANVDLDDALRFAQQAVAGIEERTQTILPDSLTLSDLRSMTSLSAYWDTLGWVQFQLANLDAAEKYLKAAWNLSQSATMGDHLAQLYQKEGKKEQAIHYWALTSALEDPSSPVARNLADLLGSQSRVDQEIGKARDEISEMRRIKVPRLIQGSAQGEVFLFYRPKIGLYDVKLINGPTDLVVRLLTAKIGADFPADSSAIIVRRAVVYCSAASDTCDVVLVPPRSVTSVN